MAASPAYADGIITILHHFTGKADGSDPIGGVVRDAAGTLYGETFQGGGVPCTTNYEASAQCGTVYSLDTAGNFKVLATFTGPNGAHGDITPLLIGSTLYGATSNGGTGDAGVVFSVNTDGTGFTLLHQFTGADGSDPVALVAGPKGTFYGIAETGGAANDGVLFSVTAAGVYTVLNSFNADGANPNSLVIGANGVLYGSTRFGATSPACENLCSIFFSYTPSSRRYATVFTLPSSGVDGNYPALGSVGPGPTLYGGDSVALFSLTAKSGFQTIAPLSYYTVGEGISSGPLATKGGTLYGVLGASQDAYYGIIYIERNGVVTDLEEFNGGNQGGGPYAQPILLPSGQLVGTNYELDLCEKCGTIWEYTPPP
jgi:uncharacterized repeat protein (TIGR03803 family)